MTLDGKTIAILTDREAVVDGTFVTSRDPKDLPAFCATLVETFAQGASARQAEHA